MSKPREPIDLETVTIRLRRGDKDVLASYFPREGYNRVIRTLVSKFIKQLESIHKEPSNELPAIELPSDFNPAE